MSRNKGVGKLYDRLTPSERFRLDIEAKARGDEAESRRLVDSFPIHHYTMTDRAFSGAWQTTGGIVLTLCGELEKYLSRLDMIDVIRELMPRALNIYSVESDAAYLSGHEAGSRYAWKKAGMEGDPPGWGPLTEDGVASEEDVAAWDPAIADALDAMRERLEKADLTPAILDGLEGATTEEALSVFEAFDVFCREELEVEPEKVFKAFGVPMWDRVRDLLKRKERLSIQADRARLSEYEATFSEAWRSHLREARRLSR